MIGNFFRRKGERNYPKFIYRLALDMFAVVYNWEPSHISGPRRGRLFEELLYKYCRHRGLSLSCFRRRTFLIFFSTSTVRNASWRAHVKNMLMKLARSSKP